MKGVTTNSVFKLNFQLTYVTSSNSKKENVISKKSKNLHDTFQLDPSKRDTSNLNLVTSGNHP